jgi:hypothetical protein
MHATVIPLGLASAALRFACHVGAPKRNITDLKIGRKIVVLAKGSTGLDGDGNSKSDAAIVYKDMLTHERLLMDGR